MGLQIIHDGQGKMAGVFVPINDWQAIIQKHEDLKVLVDIEPKHKKKLSALVGALSHQTVEAMQKHVEESRNQWEERFKNQL